MARHSKWHKVRQFKGAIDAKRSASFTKLAREITVAAREKGADPEMNARLRVAIERARKSSLPKDNIERAVQKGIGGSGDAQIEELRYEAYAPGGTALIIECLTDNRNRSTNDVKHLVTKAGGSLASTNSVTFLFERFGVVSVGVSEDIPKNTGEGAWHAPVREEDELKLIDAGAMDILVTDAGIDIRCAPNDLVRLADAVGAIHELPLPIESIEFEWVPKMTIETNEETGMIVQQLIEELEALDDVGRVYSNMA